MNDDFVTTDTILDWLKQQVEEKRPISPHLWLEAAQKLNMLSSDESDRLIELESILAVERAKLVDGGKTAAGAKVAVEATPMYMAARKQQAKMKRIEEAVRLAKLSARIKSDEMRSGL